MKKITYNNKQYVLNDPQYPVEETVTDTDMNEIKEVVNYNANESENVKNALINIKTEKSSNINVKDSSNLNAKIGVFGISEQETREGYNLFNNTKTISNVTYNSEEDKWIFNLQGKYDHIASKETFFKNIKANTNYTLYLNILKNTANNIITFNPDKTIWNAGFNIQAGKTGVVVNNIKTKEDLSSALYDLWFSHINTITGEFEVQIMLVEGTFTSENIPDYEQYGASPSPEYPSDIENVTGDIDITVFNKNLFNNTKTISDVTYNSEEDKWIFNLQGKYDHIASKETFFKNIKANTNYTLYLNILKNTANNIITFNPDKTIWNAGFNIQAGKTGVVVNNIKTKEDLSSALYDLWFSHINTITGEFEAQIMICEGAKTDNNYVKYEQQLITFPLAQGQKLYDKDYPASDGIHHKRKQIELDGTENWQENINYTTDDLLVAQVFITDTKTGTSNVLSNIATYYATSTMINTIRFATNFLCFTLNKQEFPTIEAFKTWLSEQKTNGTPVIVEYELTEEEIEPYTPEQQEAYDKLQNVLSYYNETNVFTDNAQIVFKYIADTQTWVVNLVKNEIANTNQQLLEIAGGN